MLDTLKYIKDEFNVPDDAVTMKMKDVGRIKLYNLFKELGFKLGCEVGVAKGRNAAKMLKIIPDLKLHLVDTWARRDSLRNTHARLKRFRKQITIVENASMDAVRFYNDEMFDFVYIDANHTFDFVMQDIIEWSKKVRPGGIVAGHDYYKSLKEGVVKAVKAYTNAHRIKPWFIVTKDARKASWFWVK